MKKLANPTRALRAIGLIPLLLVLNFALVNAITFSQDEVEGFYRFEEGSGFIATDSSGNNIDMTIVGATYESTNPDAANTGLFSLFFDGAENDYVSTNNPTDFAFTINDNFSITAWINTSFVVNTHNAIAGKRAPSSSKRGYLLSIADAGEINAQIRSTTSNRIEVQTINTFDDGLWHHVAMVYTANFSAEGLEIYVDAVKQDVTIIKDSLSGGLLTSSPFNIGASGNGGADEYQGKIDEVGIFNILLNQSQIQGIKDEIVEIGIIPPPQELTEGLDFLVCPVTTTKALVLIFFAIMIFFFIWIAIKTGVGFIGFFAGILLIIISLFYAPCVRFFALLFVLMGLLLIIYFVIKGLGFENRTFKPF